MSSCIKCTTTPSGGNNKHCSATVWPDLWEKWEAYHHQHTAMKWNQRTHIYKHSHAAMARQKRRQYCRLPAGTERVHTTSSRFEKSARARLSSSSGGGRECAQLSTIIIQHIWKLIAQIMNKKTHLNQQFFSIIECSSHFLSMLPNSSRAQQRVQKTEMATLFLYVLPRTALLVPACLCVVQHSSVVVTVVYATRSFAQAKRRHLVREMYHRNTFYVKMWKNAGSRRKTL